MAIHDKFALLEAAAERGDESAEAAKLWIDEVMREAFQLVNKGKPDRFSLRGLRGFTLNGGDPAERVAEALAVWLAESNPLAFAEMTGTRYVASRFDVSADGMEPLRSQSEFILLAYPGEGSTPEDIANEWQNDINRVERGEGFDYDSAALAVTRFMAEYRFRILAEIQNLANLEPAPSSDPFPEDVYPAFRLYVRDTCADEAAEREAKESAHAD